MALTWRSINPAAHFVVGVRLPARASRYGRRRPLSTDRRVAWQPGCGATGSASVLVGEWEKGLTGDSARVSPGPGSEFPLVGDLQPPIP